MEKDTDTYQIKINEARANLSEETRRAIDNIDWRSKILEIKDYTPEQLDNLEIETELLLCGLTKPEDYPSELEKRMLLTKEQVDQLLGILDRSIFQKIKGELEIIIARENSNIQKENTNNKENKNYDPRFSELSQNIQDAIARSGWREKLYKISQDHKLNIEQMGIVEDITTKMITGNIHSDQYESALNEKLGIDREEVGKIVNEVNENILKSIREGEMSSKEDTSSKEQVVGSKGEEEVPLPPYVNASSKEQVVGSKEETSSMKQVVNSRENTENKPINPLEEKMTKPVSSTQTTSNYSNPKIDPYREQF